MLDHIIPSLVDKDIKNRDRANLSDGFVIATNGQLLLRSPARHFKALPEPYADFVEWEQAVPPHDPNKTSFAVSIEAMREAYDLAPKTPMFAKIPCKKCKGEGTTGEDYCPCCNQEIDNECRECGGMGYRNGEQTGFSVMESSAHAVIMGVRFQFDVLKPLLDVMQALNSPARWVHRGKNSADVVYVSDCMFLLMPLMSPYDTGRDKMYETQIINIPSLQP